MSSKFDGLNESFNVESTEVEVDETPENGCAPRKDQLSNVTNVGITKPDRLTQDDITTCTGK